MKRIVLETVLVALTGTAVSFLANLVSPRGLQLSRDYFPSTPAAAATSGTSTGAVQSAVASTNAALEAVIARLRQKGIGMADSNQVARCFADPRYRQGLIMFVDARDDAQYQAGHIPGAYQLNYYYRPEVYLPEILQAATLAEQVVVYCGGGACEDSEFAAQLLVGAVPAEKLLVYAGGIAEWQTNGMPVEVGARNSGVMRPTGTGGP